MVDVKSGPVELVRGIVEDALGKTKQVIGIIIGNNSLIEEGKAQQDKAEAQRNAGKKEAAAEKARGKAKAYEERERAEQQ
ncbi:CsbD family protein [Mycobacterium colombiense]|uniref:CsbD family protein n=1 Tax=Mycobacterium colombiense TaxID=339268 RepID=A0A329KZV0_9MYCO|nr:CsbD family protein [Mycobacterium colombiense]RAV00706.1 CsbD family protein [Mycobacterium colombiense]